MQYFGNYSAEGHTILVVMPSRGSCTPWITMYVPILLNIKYSPEGVIAVVTKNGEFLGYWEPGFHWCLAWTEATYLVTRQNIVFDMPVTLCPTQDNIFIDVSPSPNPLDPCLRGLRHQPWAPVRVPAVHERQRTQPDARSCHHWTRAKHGQIGFIQARVLPQRGKARRADEEPPVLGHVHQGHQHQERHHH